MKSAIKLFATILFCQLAGIIGSLATIPNIKTWYLTLNKPPFNPPNWIFGPVWTLLYTLMGISLYLILKSKKQTQSAVTIFGIQLVFNTVWSLVFFGAHNLLGGLIIIVGMWLAILMTIMKFYKISKPAGKILIPYLLWVSFATILNFSVLILNP